MKNLIILISLLAISGCAYIPYYTTPETRQKFLTDHPDTPKDVQDNILHQKFSKGMTKDQVRASLGNPGEEHQASDPNGVVTIWNYQNTLIYFYDDKVGYWYSQN